MHEHVITPLNEDCPPKGGFCRTHELNIQLLAALYAVSRVLSRSLDYNETLRDVLRVLHDEAGMTRGLLSVLDPLSAWYWKSHAPSNWFVSPTNRAS